VTHEWLTVRAAAKRSGRLRVPGRIRCTPVHPNLPQARILPGK
jgi:hypothetical protein